MFSLLQTIKLCGTLFFQNFEYHPFKVELISIKSVNFITPVYGVFEICLVRFKRLSTKTREKMYRH